MDKKKYLSVAGEVLNEVDRRARIAGQEAVQEPDRLYIALQGIAVLTRYTMNRLLDGLTTPDTMDGELDRVREYIKRLKEEEARNDSQ